MDADEAAEKAHPRASALATRMDDQVQLSMSIDAPLIIAIPR
jgi:hypothetical protein